MLPCADTREYVFLSDLRSILYRRGYLIRRYVIWIASLRVLGTTFNSASNIYEQIQVVAYGIWGDPWREQVLCTDSARGGGAEQIYKMCSHRIEGTTYCLADFLPSASRSSYGLNRQHNVSAHSGYDHFFTANGRWDLQGWFHRDGVIIILLDSYADGT